jgi:Zn-dependent protease with chaperone function
LCTLLVIVIGSIAKFRELSRGGVTVATMLGGRPLNPHSTNLDERKASHVVEEMAIASGVPVPEVYILDKEDGINAFVAGHSPSDAVIGITRGSLKFLTRDELQGIVAHEFSHILNGDMRFNLRLIGLVNGILCIALLGRIMMRSSAESSDDNARGRLALVLLGLALFVIGYIGFFFAKLIKSAVSRQRELLADAFAVQLTRNPDGVVGALIKIGGLWQGSQLRAANADEASHMYFGNGLAQAWSWLMSTHPPLTERIRAIDPTFNGRFPRVDSVAPGIEPELKWPAELTTLSGRPPFVRPNEVLAHAGAPKAGHLNSATALMNSLPANLAEAAHEPPGAAAIVYGLLVSRDEAVRREQVRIISDKSDLAICQETFKLIADVQGLETRAKLPLLDLVLPALRRLSPAQYAQFKRTLEELIEADRAIDLFEYTLQKIMRRHLQPYFDKTTKPVVQYYVLRPVAPECAVLLSALAHLGHEEPSQAQAAFRQGARQLGITGIDFRLLDSGECNLAQVDAALDRLNEITPLLKRKVLFACAHTVAADERIQEEEAELLRAIADALACPIPPFA